MSPAVEVQGLVKIYGQTVRALDGVHLAVAAGRSFIRDLSHLDCDLSTILAFDLVMFAVASLNFRRIIE